MGLKARDGDSEQTQRSRPVGQRAVQARAGELPDPVGVRGSHGQRRRTGADREVRVAHFRRHSPPCLIAEPLRDELREPAQLVLEPLHLGDVALERLLGADRDRLGRELERPRVDAARARRSRSSARGPTPGSRRTANGARNAASRPAGTTVWTPGLRWSIAILATTLQEATPSAHESEVAPRTAACTASATARARPKSDATSPTSR